MISEYPKLKDSTELYDAKSKQELLALISKADIGLASLPNIMLFNSSTPMKVLDYYSSSVPCLMTKNNNNESIFEDDNSAWMSDFNTDSIKEKIEKIILLSKEEVAQVGVNGQKRLLDIRNYERIANDLAHQLNII